MNHLLYFILAAVALGIAGCASTDKPQQDDRVSSIPWAKPESWEGQGAFGSMLQGSR
ncbi:MAG: hypothetical protein ABI318_19045 [Chthoniobacteraceae bacterium]